LASKLIAVPQLRGIAAAKALLLVHNDVSLLVSHRKK